VILPKIFDPIFNNQSSKTWKAIFFIVGLILLYLTLMPSVHVHYHYRHIDKLFHFIGFGSFAFAFSVAYPKLKYYLITIIVSLLGVFVEIIQSFIPHRAFSYLDMLADFLGIAFALLTLSFIRFLFNKYSGD